MKATIIHLLLIIPLLAGCTLAEKTTASYAGVGVGATAGGVTGNPLIGIGVGALASWGVTQAFDYYQRQRVTNVRNAIASVAGDIEIGQVTLWEAEELSGTVEVLQEFGKTTSCKEILYSVKPEEEERYYAISAICRAQDGWQWAGPRLVPKP